MAGFYHWTHAASIGLSVFANHFWRLDSPRAFPAAFGRSLIDYVNARLTKHDRSTGRPRQASAAAFRFGLRTLLIVVTVAGSAFGWLGVKLREARRQHDVAATIVNLGGDVQYDYEFDSLGNYIPNAMPPGPKWLHSLLGDDFFRSVQKVSVHVRIGKFRHRRRVAAIKRAYDSQMDGYSATRMRLTRDWNISKV